jgi:hypothetical protein
MENPIIKKQSKHTSFSMFLSVNTKTQINSTLKAEIDFQVIICFDENDKPVIEQPEPMEIIELEFMGNKIPGSTDNMKETIKFLKDQMNIDVWRVCSEKLESKIEKIGISKFVEQQTKIKI